MALLNRYILRSAIRTPLTFMWRARKDLATVELIKKHTVISNDHMTPEIFLHLITPSCPLWSARRDQLPFKNPYWAFYWPGGQALSRFILDHPSVVKGRRVLDVGSGSGACAIAAALCHAQHVTANDTDLVAAVAVSMNTELNNVEVHINKQNLIGQSNIMWDCILLGDVFFDDQYGAKIVNWLQSLRGEGKSIYVGDPGRPAFKKLQHKLVRLMEYPVMDMERQGFQTSSVWTYTG